MNSQNILKFYGSKLDLRLDSSEFYDFEVGKTELDYNVDVLDLTKPITYSSLKIDESLSNMDCVREKITLHEFDNTINDSGYTYSGLSINLNYDNFVNHIGNLYEHTILNNDVFTLTGITNETHYFQIHKYNDNVLPLVSRYTYLMDNDDNFLTTLDGENLIFFEDGELGVGETTLIDVFDDSYIVDEEANNLMLMDVANDENEVLNLFSSEIIESTTKLEDITNCSPQSPKLNAKPWAYKFDTGSGSDFCSPIIRRRTEKGWTLDFIFNRESSLWSMGGVFYYLGVRGEDNVENYTDNNLSFQFTSDRRIKWVAHHYSGYCGTDSYQESFYTASGQTPQLCTIDPTKDFNITIVFDRNSRYENCDIENDGGWNDLIPEFLFTPVTNTGTTSTQLVVSNTDEILNKKWADERNRRLGTLKIYLNGRPIYKLKDWEEVIPSQRGVQPFIQSWGGGTGLMNNLHNGVSCFNIKSIKYYEEPLDFVHVKYNFLTRLNMYDFFICGDDCQDYVYGIGTEPPIQETFFIMSENSEPLTNQSNDNIEYEH
jgi:hypothetical protein